MSEEHSPIYCPVCGAELSYDDVNVAKDIALCRECKRTFSFADIAGDQQERAFDESILEQIPTSLRVENVSEGIKMSYRQFSRMGRMLIILYFAALSLFILWGALFDIFFKNNALRVEGGECVPTIPDENYLIPFIFCLLALMILWIGILLSRGGWTSVTVSSGKASLFCGLGPFRKIWNLALPPEANIRTFDQCTTGKDGQKTEQKMINISVPGKTDFTFGGGFFNNKAVVEYVAAVLRRAKA